MTGQSRDWQLEFGDVCDGTTVDADHELVAAARENPACFAALYRQYVDPIYRYCFRRLGTREAAEDATSQVFMRALESFPKYRDGSFRAWLFAIAHNVTASDRRFNRSRSNVELDLAHEFPDTGAGPEESALTAEAGGTVRRLLAELPERDRQMLELRLAGLNGQEIAALLGRSHGAIKVAQFRAISRLRDRLANREQRRGEGHDGS